MCHYTSINLLRSSMKSQKNVSSSYLLSTSKNLRRYWRYLNLSSKLDWQDCSKLNTWEVSFKLSLKQGSTLATITRFSIRSSFLIPSIRMLRRWLKSIGTTLRVKTKSLNRIVNMISFSLSYVTLLTYF